MSKYPKAKVLHDEALADVVADRMLGMGDYFARAGAGKKRIIGSSYGEVGTLKTSFWISAPGPILLQSLDRGTEGVVDVYLDKLKNEEGRDKEIYVEQYDANTHTLETIAKSLKALKDSEIEDAQGVAQEVANKIEADFVKAIEQGAKTIIWDKETQIYEIFKFAQFGAPSDAPSNYFGLFQRYRHLINLAKDSDINFGVIQGMKTPWISEMKATGKIGAKPSSKERVRRGMPEIDELMHVNIEHIIQDGAFLMNVGKVRGPGARGIQNKTIGYMEFPEFATLMFPDTTEEDWK